MRSFTALLVSLIFISPCFAKNKPAPLSADSIISLSIKAYGHLKTYTDSGKLIQTFLTDNPHKSAVVFKTAYVNTGDINFECYIPGNSNSLYTINRTNNIIKTWWGMPNRTDSPPSMLRALGAVAGISGTTSLIITELLLTAEFKNNNLYRTITKRAVAGEEQINGKDCYKIIGVAPRGPITIWIAKKDFLIRKIETEHVVDPAIIEASMKGKGDTASKERQTALKTMAMMHKIDSIRGKTAHGAFIVKETFAFFPTVDSKINPDLLKFRPNREVAL